MPLNSEDSKQEHDDTRFLTKDEQAIFISALRKSSSKKIAEELVSIQPIDSDFFKNLYSISKDEKELKEEGYTPISNDTKLVWKK